MSKVADQNRLRMCSEAELLPQVQDILGWLVVLIDWWLRKLLLNDFLHEFLCLDTAICGVHLLIGHEGLAVDLSWHLVSGWHHVVVVDILHEGLHAGALCDLLLAHGLCDLQWSSFDASNQGMSKTTVLGAIVKSLHDDRLLAGKSALEAHDNAAGFDELAHCVSDFKLATLRVEYA